jgi:hypothetical protein
LAAPGILIISHRAVILNEAAANVASRGLGMTMNRLGSGHLRN